MSTMAFMPSPGPKWYPPHPHAHPHQPPHHRHPHMHAHAPPHPHVDHRHPYVPSQPRYLTPSFQRHPFTASNRGAPVPNNLAESFMPLKSPMSQCIDTIIGAAEAVNRRDAWLDSHRPMKRQKTTKEAKQADIISNTTAPIQKHTPGDELEEVLRDKDFVRSLVLTMALERPRKEKDTEPKKLPPAVIGEGFFWKEFPLLENVLFEQMREYYAFSSNSRQCKTQQAYNNKLVVKVRGKAEELGYTFQEDFFNDKRLRDRIRCFYKTHLQNAKKRLSTMTKYLHKPEERRAIWNLVIKTKNSPELVPPDLADVSDDDSCRGRSVSESS